MSVSQSHAEAGPGAAPGSGLERRLAAAAVYVIAGYALALALTRLALSPYLEIDEAQFVGQVDWRLVYANSHPPLYNWALRLLLEASGWRWAVACAALKFGLLGAYYILVWDAARRLAGRAAGPETAALTALTAVAAAAFLPQIVWQSAHTLAHSVMVLTGCMALAHALVLVRERPSAARYAWLGAAAALGALAKFNFFLFAAPLAIAAMLDPALRRSLLRPGAWIALAVFLAAVAPILVAAALDLESSAGRLSKLYAEEGAWYDPPGLGVDGFLALIVACLAWAGPLVVIWGAARWRADRVGWRRAETADPLVRALGRTMGLGILCFAAIVLAADMHKVHERYLTPILAVLPVWVAMQFPLKPPARGFVLGLAGAAFAAALIGVVLMVQNERHRYAIPYGAAAEAILEAEIAPAPILAKRHSDVANLTLALRWPGAASPRYAEIEDRVLLVWRGARPARRSLIPEGFALAGAKRTFSAPYTNWRTDAFEISFQEATRR